jgi:hypothetical protein
MDVRVCSDLKDWRVEEKRMRQTFLWLATAVMNASLVVGQQPTVTRLDGSTISAAEIDGTVTRLLKAAEVTGAGIAVFP